MQRCFVPVVLAIGLAASAIISSLACGGSKAPVGPTVSAVALATPGGIAAVIASLGGTLQLSAQATGPGGQVVSGASFAWTSSNPEIATVDAGGLVTAHKNGTATISAMSGGIVGSLVIAVQQAANSIAVTPPSPTIERGASQAFAAVATDANGNAVPGAVFAWSSSDATFASVDPATGQASGVKAGTATVRAAFQAKTGEAILTVSVPGVAAVELSAPGSQLHAIDATLQLGAVAKDARGAAVPEAQIAWTSSAERVATVDPTGLVTARSNGSATLTATSGTHSATAQVTVAQEAASLQLVAHGGASTTLTALGDTVQLDAQLFDGTNHAIAGAAFTYAACDGDTVSSGCAGTVVSVSATGVVAALKNGAATVQASSQGRAATLSFTVAQVATTVTVAPDTQAVPPAGHVPYTATVRDANAYAIAGVAVSWSSDDVSIATIVSTGFDSNGAATAAATATATAVANTTLRAGVGSGAAKKEGTATLSVDPALIPVDHIALSGNAGPLTALGATLTLSAEARDASDHPVVNQDISWSNGTPGVASLGAASGPQTTVTALANGGTLITASAGGISSSATVQVAQMVSSMGGAPASALVSFGDTAQLTVQDANANFIVPGAALTLTFTACDGLNAPPCSTATVASVSGSGLVAALANGAARITAKTSGAGLNASMAADISVAQQVVSVGTGGAATALASLGTTLQLHALDARAHDVALPVAWTSTDGTIATVGASTGLVTALANGTATVTAAAGPSTASAAITVQQQAATLVLSPKQVMLLPGVNQQFSASARDANGHLLIPQPGFTFAGDLDTVATVTGTGLAQGVASGGPVHVTVSGGGLTDSTILAVPFDFLFTYSSTLPTLNGSLGQVINLTRGQAVRWHNTDPTTPHQVISDTAAFPMTAVVINGFFAPVLFDLPAATYKYHCNIHGSTSMRGQIVIQ